MESNFWSKGLFATMILKSAIPGTKVSGKEEGPTPGCRMSFDVRVALSLGTVFPGEQQLLGIRLFILGRKIGFIHEPSPSTLPGFAPSPQSLCTPYLYMWHRERPATMGAWTGKPRDRRWAGAMDKRQALLGYVCMEEVVIYTEQPA